MIARVWRGITAAEKADAYIAYLRETALSDYARAPGNRGVTVFKRIQGEHAEIVLLSMWDSMDAVRAFAGGNPDMHNRLVIRELDLDLATRHRLIGGIVAIPVAGRLVAGRRILGQHRCRSDIAVGCRLGLRDIGCHVIIS